VTADDDTGEIVTRVRIEQPWYQRPAGTIFLIALSASVLIFAVSQILTVEASRQENDDLRRELAIRDAQNTSEQECRAQRNADLNAITSDVTGEKAKLDVLVAQSLIARTRLEIADVQPYLDTINAVADRRVAAAAAVRTAVEDCKGR